jgi:hypothetical protein
MASNQDALNNLLRLLIRAPMLNQSREPKAVEQKLRDRIEVSALRDELPKDSSPAGKEKGEAAPAKKYLFR